MCVSQIQNARADVLGLDCRDPAPSLRVERREAARTVLGGPREGSKGRRFVAIVFTRRGLNVPSTSGIS
jgi:hypothetical protein